MARAQGGQIGDQAMLVQHHGQAGQATFGGFGLQDHGQLAPESERESIGPAQKVLQARRCQGSTRRVTLNIGSSIHS